MTKNQTDKVGDRIRQETIIDDRTLEQLQLYRISFKDSLSKIFNILCESTKQISSDNLVTYRIKRIESIVSKLKRFPDMKLSRMADIGGCRCILRSDKEVYKLKKIIE